MLELKSHCIHESTTIRFALQRLNEVNGNAIFVLDKSEKVLGTVTDGDIRRGIIQGLDLNDSVEHVMNRNFRFISSDDFSSEQIKRFKKDLIFVLPVLTREGKLEKLIDLRQIRSLLPVDVLLMAGGRGERLRPLTDSVPKPMLHLGDKPIIEINIDRLIEFGIGHFYISVRYLAEQISDWFGDGSEKGVTVEYIHEDKPLGTLGAAKLIKAHKAESTLIMNSDLLTNIDFEDFYRSFTEQGSDMLVASIPYQVKVPYGVLETSDGAILSLKEKPTYTYYSNAGIYLIRNTVLDLVPENEFYNATDLMETLINSGRRVHNYPIVGYWMDIGNPEDYARAQEDIKHIHF